VTRGKRRRRGEGGRKGRIDRINFFDLINFLYLDVTPDPERKEGNPGGGKERWKEKGGRGNAKSALFNFLFSLFYLRSPMGRVQKKVGKKGGG